MTSVKEVLNNVDIDESLDKDILLRQSKLLYPEVEEWVLNIAIEAYLKQRGIDTNSGELKEEMQEMQEIN